MNEVFLRVFDIFSGISGFSLGFSWASHKFKTVAFCEIDEYACKILKKQWPGVPIFPDVTKINEKELMEVGPIDLISAGFP